MSERGAMALLRSGIARYAAGDLVPRACERTGFDGGARWIARAMGRALSDGDARRAGRLGALKYATALGVAGGGAAVACRVHVIVAMVVFVGAFYAVEVQGLFLFPLVALGERAPWRRSRALVAKGGGTLRAVVRVLPIAAYMIFAGPFRGFTRAWCEGCLAVMGWFAAARRDA
ncbi:hypothetical protein BH09MYX1_BH09MYX1_08020 [soil metagenome]